jgi:hypothetical protein
MVILEKDHIEFRFPEVHAEARCTIEFQRTLRIPDDNKSYPLPPGLGEFPLAHVEDYADKLPDNWSKHGGVFLPMYQAEALWVRFHCDYPFAIKIAAGKVNAVTGSAWSDDLVEQPQDYLVIPKQPWLDGFCVGKGLIRQFVAMPLGDGYTAEEQLTDKAEFGDLQIIAYPMKAEYAQDHLVYETPRFLRRATVKDTAPSYEMGLAPGGLMKQEFYEDRYGDDVWETGIRSRCFVHLLNSLQYLAVTGRKPLTKPPTASDYTKAGLPWFDYYGSECKPLPGSKILAGLHSIGAMQVQKGEKIISDTEVTDPQLVIKLAAQNRSVVEGDW